jgi:hypothetical protein
VRAGLRRAHSRRPATQAEKVRIGPPWAVTKVCMLPSQHRCHRVKQTAACCACAMPDSAFVHTVSVCREPLHTGALQDASRPRPSHHRRHRAWDKLATEDWTARHQPRTREFAEHVETYPPVFLRSLWSRGLFCGKLGYLRPAASTRVSWPGLRERADDLSPDACSVARPCAQWG